MTTSTQNTYTAENTDIFNTCTKRCTRRAWDLFLAVKDDIELFNSRMVRGRLTVSSAAHAQTLKQILVDEGGITELTLTDNIIELTTTLATMQLVIRHPETQMFDALKVE